MRHSVLLVLACLGMAGLPSVIATPAEAGHKRVAVTRLAGPVTAVRVNRVRKGARLHVYGLRTAGSCAIRYRLVDGRPYRHLACVAPAVPAYAAPQPAWSYDRFRQIADFSQHGEAWQSAMAPGPSNAIIPWGY
jgi:hypothetical protein